MANQKKILDDHKAAVLLKSELAIKDLPPYYMQFFKYDHLPEHLQEVSKEFHDIALRMYEMKPKIVWLEGKC